MGNWSELPGDILILILTSLTSLIDLMSFSSVCKTWRAEASSLSPSHVKSRFPPLLLCPTVPRDTGELSSLRLMDPANPSFSTSLRHVADRFTSYFYKGLHCNFSHGCLLRVQKFHVMILNLSTDVEIQSPRVPYMQVMSSPVLTAPLSSPDSAVLLSFRHTLLYWRVGTPSWSSCDGLSGKSSALPGYRWPCSLVSAAVHQGNVFLRDSPNNLSILEFSPKFHVTPLIADPGMPENVPGCFIEGAGDLLSLNLIPIPDSMSSKFELYRLNISGNVIKWIKQEGMVGNWALYIGQDSRVNGVAVENPHRWGGRSNVIYLATGAGDEDEDAPWIEIDLGAEISLDTPFKINTSELCPVWVPLDF